MPAPGPRDDLSEVLFLYTVAASEAEARRVASHLLKRRLVACVNAFPVSSRYWWKGKIESASEVAMVMKSTQGLVREVAKELRRVHSYDVPALVALPVAEGLGAYLDWVRGETRGPPLSKAVKPIKARNGRARAGRRTRRSGAWPRRASSA
ncbi:MAG TPA: divalent-cation tolerance protein CutA [Candidatus Thermoplasmatota archaeon]|nr:divalent-cation tolerance protein CutA [Candidatus Thermoplasmatota archaeon]